MKNFCPLMRGECIRLDCSFYINDEESLGNGCAFLITAYNANDTEMHLHEIQENISLIKDELEELGKRV